MKCSERLMYLAQNSEIDDLLEAVGVVLDRHRVDARELESVLYAVEQDRKADEAEKIH